MSNDLKSVLARYKSASENLRSLLQGWMSDLRCEQESATKVGYLYKTGDKVFWKFGGASGHGTIKEIYTESVTVKIKDTDITREGTEEVPAYLIETDAGEEVLKLATEIDRTARDS